MSSESDMSNDLAGVAREAPPVSQAPRAPAENKNLKLSFNLMHQANLDAETARILINGGMNLCARPSFYSLQKMTPNNH